MYRVFFIFLPAYPLLNWFYCKSLLFSLPTCFFSSCVLINTYWKGIKGGTLGYNMQDFLQILFPLIFKENLIFFYIRKMLGFFWAWFHFLLDHLLRAFFVEIANTYFLKIKPLFLLVENKTEILKSLQLK